MNLDSPAFLFAGCNRTVMCGYITVITVGGDVSRCLGGIRFSGQSLRLEPLAVVVKGLLLCCIFCLFRLSWFERPAGFKHSAANGVRSNIEILHF